MQARGPPRDGGGGEAWQPEPMRTLLFCCLLSQRRARGRGALQPQHTPGAGPLPEVTHTAFTHAGSQVVKPVTNTHFWFVRL